MKTNFICPECQSTFKETPSSADFNTQCPHCGTEVSIPADPAKAEKARKEAEEKAEAARREAEQQAEVEAERAAKSKLDAENAKALAWVERRVTRICPHCKHEGTWVVLAEPGDKSWVVRCNYWECRKSFTILNSSDDLLTPLADILNELERVRFRIGVLIFGLFVLPVIIGIILAIIRAN